MQQQTANYQNQQNSYEQTQQGYEQPQQTHPSTTPKKLATKYGDGFVTSHSHPELGEQYGNTTTR